MAKPSHKKRGNHKNKNKNFKKSNIKPGIKKKAYRDYKHTEQRRLLVKSKEDKIKRFKESVQEESDDERNVDIVDQLLSSFSTNHALNKQEAVESDDSSEEEMETDNEDRQANDCPAEEETVSEIKDNENDHDSTSEVDDNENDCGFNIEKDPFSMHLTGILKLSLLANLQAPSLEQTNHRLQWPTLGDIKLTLPVEKSDEDNEVISLEKEHFVKAGEPPERITKVDWNILAVEPRLSKNIQNCNKLYNPSLDDNEELTRLQKELFSILNNYQDLMYPLRNVDNGEEVRFAYCLHVVNHVLKARKAVMNHNRLLTTMEKQDIPEEFRDQGLVRPKILILVPFRDSCHRIVNMMSTMLMPNKNANIINKPRFNEEFTGSELLMPKRNPKPEDFQKLFSGNVDDNFKIGLSFTKNSLKLYSDFYASDVIIASPLGIRMVIGAEGEKERDYDFLASVEMLILDQTDVFLMQNWDHVLHIMNHLHMQPRESHGADFSRVRLWALNGWARYYRQTILFSSILTPEMNAIFSRHCTNYAGLAKVSFTNSSSISQVLVPLPHVFRRFESATPVEASDDRFRSFLEDVLPQFSDSSAVLIYVPSYFDFVRIRNYLKSKDFSFVQISEYSKDGKVARARDMFFHEEAKILLYSERFHFYRRVNIKGIRHLIYYQPPVFPHFYSEMCNLMQDCNQNAATQSGSQSVTVLFSKYDCYSLSGIIRPARANHIMASEKPVFIFTTG